MEQERRSCTILIKRRVSGDPGPPAYLAPGELAFNEASNALFFGTNSPSLSTTDPGTF